MTRLATAYCRASQALDAPLVRVEVHISGGLPGMTIVGLPETAVREARDRVRAALQSSGFRVPPSRITINLAPGELPKQGSRFDLAIALGILQAAELLRLPLEQVECLAELGLDGQLRPVAGVLPAARACAASGRRLLLAPEAAAEAALVEGLELGAAPSLLSLCAALQGEGEWAAPAGAGPAAAAARPAPPARGGADLAEVSGQPQARRVLEVAAAGGHHLLLFGPPGSGKSMLAARLPGLLPPLSAAQALELACVQSLGPEGFDLAAFGHRPFRAPHHSASAVALVGGGREARPGEISLASYGTLCLDEIAEFPRSVLEVLRGPLDSGEVAIARAAARVRYPARFQLVATMNPCPCGFLGDAGSECRCTAEQVQRYRARLSGPLLDRIDLQLGMRRPPPETLLNPQAGEASAAVAARVAAARARMQARQGGLNAQLAGAELQRHCQLRPAERQLAEAAMARLRLSARGWHRSLRVARTLADMQDSPRIERPHLAEALGYRQFERA